MGAVTLAVLAFVLRATTIVNLFMKKVHPKKIVATPMHWVCGAAVVIHRCLQ